VNFHILYTFPLSLSETAMTQATEGFRRRLLIETDAVATRKSARRVQR
jgi:hypothetical protein